MNPGTDWGPYPPPNLDSLKDLSAANFPEQVGSFTLDGTSEGMASANASYDDLSRVLSFTVDLSFSLMPYEQTVSDFENPSQVGDAICGTYTSEVLGSTLAQCAMAGKNEVLWVLGFEGTVEELAALTQELYESM